jgi:membrane-bound serine protease (ClpP class)
MRQHTRFKEHYKYLFIATLILLLAFISSAGLVKAQDREFLVVEISGPVTPAMASYFERAINAATESGAAGIVIVLDTPGGSLDTTLDIVRLFRGAAVPVIVFIGPPGAQAASAGSVITAAAHVAVMAPETVIGAASPVDGSGADIQETLFKKITEDMKATMRNLTERRGETAVTLAEAMIDDAKAVTSKEALEAHLIDAIASDVPSLLEEIDGLIIIVDGQEMSLDSAGASQTPFSMSPIEQLLHALSNPLLIGILLTIGVQAIFIELSSPGGWVAGFIGVVFLALALYGLGTLPANWFGLVLIFIAFVLFVLEIKTPATGILGVVGIMTFLAGLLLLFNSPGTPSFARISISSAVAITLFTAGFFIFIIAKALGAQRKTPIVGLESMVGQIGPVRSDLKLNDSDHYSGHILVNGELWRACSDEAIERGEEVVVKSVDGFTLKVKKINKGF